MEDDTLVVADTGNHRVLIFPSYLNSEHPEAEVVLGQPDFLSESHANGGPERGLFLPTGVMVYDHRLIVADAWHHRVLVWDQIPAENWSKPDHVIGQATTKEIEVNRGGPCSPTSLYWPFGIGVAGGKFWIADTGNRRVLGWKALPLHGEAPDVVLGQKDGYANEENRGELGPASFRWVHDIAGDESHLFCCDAGNHRVLNWPAGVQGDSDCSFVLGQQDPYSAQEWPYGPQSPDKLRFPYGASFDGGHLAIADTANNRILLYNSPPSRTAQGANAVLGQPDFAANGENHWKAVTMDTLCWPYGICLKGDRLAVADSGNNRVMIWNLKW